MDYFELRPGQIWKNKRRKPTSVFLITKITEYDDGSFKLHGLQTNEILCALGRTLHEESLRKMFPYLLFDSYVPETEEDK